MHTLSLFHTIHSTSVCTCTYVHVCVCIRFLCVLKGLSGYLVQCTVCTYIYFISMYIFYLYVYVYVRTCIYSYVDVLGFIVCVGVEGLMGVVGIVYNMQFIWVQVLVSLCVWCVGGVVTTVHLANTLLFCLIQNIYNHKQSIHVCTSTVYLALLHIFNVYVIYSTN